MARKCVTSYRSVPVCVHNKFVFHSFMASFGCIKKQLGPTCMHSLIPLRHAACTTTPCCEAAILPTGISPAARPPPPCLSWTTHSATWAADHPGCCSSSCSATAMPHSALPPSSKAQRAAAHCYKARVLRSAVPPAHSCCPDPAPVAPTPTPYPTRTSLPPLPMTGRAQPPACAPAFPPWPWPRRSSPWPTARHRHRRCHRAARPGLPCRRCCPCWRPARAAQRPAPPATTAPRRRLRATAA